MGITNPSVASLDYAIVAQQAVPDPVAEIILTDLAGYSEWMIFGDNLVSDADGLFVCQFSDNNGASWIEDYSVIQASGFVSSQASIRCVGTVTSEEPLEFLVRVLSNGNGVYKFVMSSANLLYRGIEPVGEFNAVRIFHSAAANIIAGAVRIQAR